MPTFTQPSSSRTITRQSTLIDAAGNVQLTLSVVDAAGVALETRVLRIPADGSAITDTNGVQIVAAVPVALATAIATFVSQLDSAIASAATAGKFNR